MNELLRELMWRVNHVGPQGWLLILAGVIAVGVFCLRGFGSRSNY